MNMVRLLYASRFAGTVGPEQVQDILNVSREHNKKAGLTGVLCYDPHFFLQCLEGPSDAVNVLYNEIVRDNRHEEVTLMAYSDIDERAFENWSMAYVRINELTEPLLLKYSTGSTFNPFTMRGSQALEFITALSRQRERFLQSIKDKS